ncbi:Nif3-like dinuclear metal center hexameric protein [Brevibacillus laterosporus]|uniref:Nif3-like dinuclear metal center hexameric protein n=1 Tax=Brevibacillus laterosporus TaxID=1465 RepID=UPI0035A5A91E
MLANGQTIIQLVERLAPKSLAMEWDKIGLQVGTLQKPVQKVMTALDVNEEVVEEAIQKGVSLIIAHHPVIFRPLKHLRTDLPAGRLLAKLLAHDIAVYSMHTNLDVANGGLNDWLAEELELQQTEILDVTYQDELKKLVTFVPKSHREQVFQAMANAGAGHIGQYSHCSFQIEGTGTFLPLEGTTPFIGEQGKVEHVDEVRIETVIKSSQQASVIKAMKAAHPYDEVAYDIYPLDLPPFTLGLGRIGKLAEPMTLEEYAQFVKRKLGLEGVRIVGSKDRIVKKVAVLGGSGGSYLLKAAFRGADVMVTGDVGYHEAQDAFVEGLSIIDAGHNIEKIMKPRLASFIQGKLQEQKYKTEVIASEVHTDPFQYL